MEWFMEDDTKQHKVNEKYRNSAERTSLMI